MTDIAESILATQPTQPTNCSNLDFVRIANSWRQHACAFKTAADRLVTDAVSQPRESDHLFWPLLFLYRHDLELMLKNLVNSSVPLRLAPKPAAGHHYLDKLWRDAKKILEDLGDDTDAEQVANAETLVLYFDKIDPSSCEFRYPTDKNGINHLESLPSSAQLTKILESMDYQALKTEIDKVHEFLDRYAALLDARFDDSNALAFDDTRAMSNTNQ